MSLTELPFNLQGNIFRSPMPFGNYDPSGEAFQDFKQKKIKVIVLLAQDEECKQKAGRNLREFYKKEGFQVIYFPIPDIGIPLKEDLEHFAQKKIEFAKKGQNIVIHCSAGRGRTGMFAACLAKQIFDLPGEETINWVRQYIDGAVETDRQNQLIIDDLNDQIKNI
jgi:protein-tyrosine phosphatase